MLPADSRLLALRDWLPGQVLHGTRGAQYHLRERVGEGGQGWVFRASWDEPGGYAVVVKVLRPDAVTPQSLARFEREAQVLRMLGQAARPNPHVVRFFDHATAHLSLPGGGEPIALPFTVLEFVNGTTLQDVLAKGGGVGLGLDRARRIARQIVLALEDVHAHKVVHRDLKPSNVLLANQGGVEVAKVTDFGLVKLVDIGLGRTTALAGATLGYAPPEQFEQGNRRVSRRTDVFSFAAVFYEMLTGVRAFPHGDGENPLVVVTRLLNGPRPTLGSTRGVLPRELAMRPDVISGLDALLVRATAAEPAERHASIGELWRAVEQLLGAASDRPSPLLPPTELGVAVETATSIDLPAPVAAASRPSWEGSPEEHAGAWRRSSEPPELDAKLPPPAFWRWRVRIPPLRTAAVRAALFDPGGESAIAVGASGFLRWESSEWIYGSGTPEVDPRAVRGLAWLGHGELVVYGAGGLAARLVPGERLEAWVVPDRELTFHGAHVDAREGTVTLVGERPGRRSMPRAAETMAIVAQFSRGKLSFLSDVPPCARLRGAARVQAGEIVCCGDWGGIVRLDKGTAHHVGSICGGNLHAIASLTDGSAVTVGAGGHALLLSRRLQGQLEAVQTTRDLLSLAVDSSGVAWAGSAQARLLRRTAGSWVRMSAELRLSSSVVALWAAPHAVRAICDDGAFIEGTLSDDHVDG